MVLENVFPQAELLAENGLAALNFLFCLYSFFFLCGMCARFATHWRRCVLFMFIDFKWFEDFLSLAKNNNFSRAAEERHVTQSAFSRRIKALELWIGVPLVDRSTYPTELTDEGKIFTKKAREVVLMMHGIKNEFHEMRIKGEHTLHFTSLHTTALTFFPKWLIDIERDLGALSTRLEADSMHNCVQNMTE